jgi:hypothetical protein
MASDIEINYNEPEQICKQHDGTVYKRTGYCCHCGQCCIGCPIAALVWTSEGKSKCSQRSSSYYLNGCNVWPSFPGHISDKPKCTYKFEKVS